MQLKKGMIVLTKNGLQGEIHDIEFRSVILKNIKKTENYKPSCEVITGRGYKLFSREDIKEIIE